MSRPSSRTWPAEPQNGRGRRLVVSFHDLAPHALHACERFLERVEMLGIRHVSLLVVPRWHGGQSFDADPGFVRWLKARAAAGHEVCLHGYCHRAEEVAGGPVAQLVGRVYTAGEGEFYRIDAAEAEEKLRAGLAVFERIGLPVNGFTPPAWLLSAAGREALRRLGFRYTTSINHVKLLQQRCRLYAPSLVFSSRNAWRRRVSRAWGRLALARYRQAPVLRVAAHPVDLDHPEMEQALYTLIERAAEGRTCCTYHELADEWQTAHGSGLDYPSGTAA